MSEGTTIYFPSLNKEKFFFQYTIIASKNLITKMGTKVLR